MRLLVVSNRLPITAHEKEGRVKFQKSVGGLATGISAYLNSLGGEPQGRIDEWLWIGWPGLAVEASKEAEYQEQMREFGTHPVFLTDKAVDKFYHGFSNKTLWPLFHFFPHYTQLEEDAWLEYKRVNQKFCEAVLEVLRPGDLLWIHDYQLMLLPKMIRDKRPEASIGFFLHIPFPSFEIFRFLPMEWRQALLEGLLGADLVGFHTHSYTQSFLHCVLRILGYEHNMGQIVFEDRLVKAETFPMGIDYDAFAESVTSLEVLREEKKLKASLKDLEVVLSVDRLDYTKGILNRLQGYELFLERNSHWLKKVVLLLVLVPSRIRVEHYQEMKRQIDEYIGRINGRFGTLDWTPILYQFRALSIPTLTAIYHSSDVALVTPLRDGMNLIAKEYLACRTDGSGALILSEMAGASQELGEALIINPNSKQEIAQALKSALEMQEAEQIQRNRAMQERLKKYNVVRWASDFVDELIEVKKAEEKFKAKWLSPSIRDELLESFRQANSRLLFLDYDGTLVPYSARPELAMPGEGLLQMLTRIASLPATEIVVVSGRDRGILEEWFKGIPVHLVAEHGAWIKAKGEDWRLYKTLRNDWKAQLIPVLRWYVDRLPESFLEEKEYSMVWHYRRADPELASLRKKELMDDLVHFTATADLQILPGHKVVEVRNAGVSKGTAAMEFIAQGAYDFIMAVGDDQTDEEMFHALPESAYSIRIGMANSFAKFNLLNHRKVFQLLESLVEGEDQEESGSAHAAPLSLVPGIKGPGA